MKWPVILKGGGYLISAISVLLLGVVSWDGAKDHPLMLTALVAGMVASMGGMGARWIAFLRQQKEKRAELERIGRLEQRMPGTG